MSDFSRYPSDPHGRPPRRGWLPSRAVLLPVLALLVVGVAVVVTVVVVSGEASASVVTTEPAVSAGVNPFLPPVTKQQTPVTAPPGTGGSFPGNTPGLYGGTMNNASCDAAAMVAFLQGDPGKAAAWAEVEGITPADIPSYVAELTPVVLRSDTYVTNHGYANGRATTLISVLQAGTAVFVDKFGVPRVRCYCGNPLTPAALPIDPTYTGTSWPAFTPTSITIIQQTTVVIEQFTLVDVVTNQVFTRPRGPAVDGDRLGEPGSGGTATPTAPPTATPQIPTPTRGPTVQQTPPPQQQVRKSSGSHVLTQADGPDCSFSDAPRITGSFVITVRPDGTATGQLAAEGSGTRDLSCGDFGGRMFWHQQYTATFNGRVEGGKLTATGSLHNNNSTTLSGCTNAGHPVDCPSYETGGADFPITLSGSYDAATGTAKGAFVVGGVARSTKGTWSAA